MNAIHQPIFKNTQGYGLVQTVVAFLKIYANESTVFFILKLYLVFNWLKAISVTPALVSVSLFFAFADRSLMRGGGLRDRRLSRDRKSPLHLSDMTRADTVHTGYRGGKLRIKQRPRTSAFQQMTANALRLDVAAAATNFPRIHAQSVNSRHFSPADIEYRYVFVVLHVQRIITAHRINVNTNQF